MFLSSVLIVLFVAVVKFCQVRPNLELSVVANNLPQQKVQAEDSQ
jgi:hypothetical protein